MLWGRGPATLQFNQELGVVGPFRTHPVAMEVLGHSGSRPQHLSLLF